MYVCICHGLNDRAVATAVGAGARSVSEVFRHHQAEPACGRCIGCIRDALGTCRGQTQELHEERQEA